MQRRDWLKQVGVSGVAAIPSLATADTNQATDVMASLVGSATVKLDNRIELMVRENAENGAVVPVGIYSNVPNTLRLVLLADNYPHPKVAELDTSNPLVEPRLSTHLQLTTETRLTALAETPTGWHKNSAQVKTLGETCEK